MKIVVLHPFLFALWPIALLTYSNMAYVLPEEALIPVLAALSAAAILLIILKLITKDIIKAAVLSSVVVLWFSSYAVFAQIFEVLGRYFGQPSVPASLVTTAYFLAILLAVLALWRVRRYPAEINSILNLVAFSMVIYNVVMICIHECQINQTYNSAIAAFAKQDDGIKLCVKPNSPDIYYIILDSMGSHNVLKEFYNYDNEPYLDFLRRNGFSVPDHSRSNYEFTYLSLASSLNMGYLNFIEDKTGSTSIEYQILGRLIQQNRAVRLLKSAGYKFVNCDSGFGPTNWMPMADTNIDTGWGAWTTLVLLQSTILSRLNQPWNPLFDAAAYKKLAFFEKVEKISEIPGPKFVFAHILLPHPPFLLHKDGSPVLKEQFLMQDAWEKQPYLEQAQLAEQEVESLVTKLLKDKRHQPVIIIQGDHGPACMEFSGHADDPTYWRERFRIFNAYFLPNIETKNTKNMYDTITPVNTFRTIFNDYFSTNYQRLPDRSMHSFFQRPYDFRDITDKVDWNRKGG